MTVTNNDCISFVVNIGFTGRNKNGKMLVKKRDVFEFYILHFTNSQKTKKCDGGHGSKSQVP